MKSEQHKITKQLEAETFAKFESRRQSIHCALQRIGREIEIFGKGKNLNWAHFGEMQRIESLLLEIEDILQ